MKQNLVSIVEEYQNFDLLRNARSDSVIYHLKLAPIGRKERPAKHEKRFLNDDDFVLSDEKIDDYYIGVRRVITNLFGVSEVFVDVIVTLKRVEQKVYFLVQPFQKSWRFVVHGRKNLH